MNGKSKRPVKVANQPSHPQKANNTKDNPSEGLGEAVHEIRAIKESLAAFMDKHGAREEAEEKNEKAKRNLEVKTFRAVVAYTTVTLGLLILNAVQIHVASTANAISQQNLVDAQRPYLTFGIEKPIGSVTNPMAGGLVFYLPIEIKNDGNTWPRNLHLKGWCPTPSTGLIDERYTGWPEHDSAPVVGARTTNLVAACGLNASQLILVESGVYTEYIGLEVDYGDIISPKDHWVTKFCDEIVGLNGDGTPGKPFEFSGITCPFNNCTDDECKTQTSQ